MKHAVRFAAIVLLWIAGCRDAFLQDSAGVLELQPNRVEFGQHFVGTSVEQEITLLNTGRSALPIEWELPGPPFELASGPATAPAGGLGLTVRFRPEVAGSHSAALVGHYGESRVSLWMEGTALGPPSCAPVACHQQAFDPTLGECVETALPDGIACDAHSVCLLATRCQSGRCIGTQVSCDDGNACTVDVCDAELGCQHLPAPACPGDGKCQVGVCHPMGGCQLAPADDGTLCGPTRTCDLADVCIDGACLQRDPPDGFICAPASPCQEDGRCVGSLCSRAPPLPLQPSWSFDAKLATTEAQALHDLVLEPDGALTLMGFFAKPVTRANALASKVLASPARRCLLWNAKLVCADYPYFESGKVSSIDTLTGSTRWTFDLPAARPDWVQLAAPGRLFMARLTVLGSDRLAALFEAYPAGQPADTQCRLYFLVVLDAGGALVAAARVSDGLLDQCNHPHPFGMAADVTGDLFIAFSPSLPGAAPLVPLAPTLLVSYSRDGAFRWKTQDPMAGGELAVALGSLYPENAASAFSAVTGNAARLIAPPPSGRLGRVVATGDRLIPAPAWGNQLYGYELAPGPAKWVHLLAPGENLVPGLVRLASWKRKEGAPPVSVALVFKQRAGQPWVVALGTDYGNEEWSCPIAGPFRSLPQLFEVVHGSMALMEGSDQCGACDPSFAQSQAAFHTYSLPGIELPVAPWTGTWGGPSHDHREDPITGSPAPSL